MQDLSPQNLIFHKITATRSLTGTNGKYATWSRGKSRLFKLHASVSLCGNCKCAWSQDGHSREENSWSDSCCSEMYLSQEYFSPAISLTSMSSFFSITFSTCTSKFAYTSHATVQYDLSGIPADSEKIDKHLKGTPPETAKIQKCLGWGFFSETDFCSEWKMP